MLKFVPVVLLLISLAPLGLECTVKCQSCDLIPEDASKSIFLIDNYLESCTSDESNSASQKALEEALNLLELPQKPDTNQLTEPNLKLIQFSNQAILREMLKDIISFKDSNCDEIAVGKLVTIEARLEEGENPMADLVKKDAKYKTRKLTRLLEEQHLRLFEVCKESAKSDAVNIFLADNTSVREARQVFVKFGKFLDQKLGAVQQKSVASLWMRGLMGFFKPSDVGDFKNEYEFEVAIMKRGKMIVERDYMFEKIESSLGEFFSDPNPTQTVCMQLKRNLVNSYSGLLQQLNASFEPLLLLSNFQPSFWTKLSIPGSVKRQRPIFKVHDSFKKDFLPKNGPVDDLITLKGFIHKSIKRANNICSPKIGKQEEQDDDDSDTDD